MKQEFTNYFQLASSINEAYQVRKKIIALAVGHACASNLPIPSSKVINVHEHYITNVSTAVRRWVGYFNEVMPFDVIACCDAAQRFWMLRYNAVHDCPDLSIVVNDFFGSMFGIPNLFDNDTIDILNNHNIQIGPIYRAACLVIANYNTQVNV